MITQLTSPRRMPFAAAWQRELTRRHGAPTAARLMARAETRYAMLLADRPQPSNGVLRMHLKGNILPGLALYQVMCTALGDQQKALAEVDALFTAAPSILGRWVGLLRYLPGSFTLLRRIIRWGMRVGFPPEGWAMTWRADNDTCLAFDIRRCFYLDTLTAYGAPELTVCYCASDDRAFAMLPPSIAWERTRTLGRGADDCNFCWRRVEAASVARLSPTAIHNGLAIFRFGAGAPVLLMPYPHALGIAGDGDPELLTIIERLVEHGHEVITFDPPGSGQSSRPVAAGSGRKCHWVLAAESSW
ncbi:MAG: L-2-amino-thiazoline-4-carboxylic acid hydrolase, partial [Blastochloris sp.]|nr:L-2-amino-thiazoline-4-carboxylic acid hydrolase [Blastochloris sp.]